MLGSDESIVFTIAYLISTDLTSLSAWTRCIGFKSKETCVISNTTYTTRGQVHHHKLTCNMPTLSFPTHHHTKKMVLPKIQLPQFQRRYVRLLSPSAPSILEPQPPVTRSSTSNVPRRTKSAFSPSSFNSSLFKPPYRLQQSKARQLSRVFLETQCRKEFSHKPPEPHETHNIQSPYHRTQQRWSKASAPPSFLHNPLLPGYLNSAVKLAKPWQSTPGEKGGMFLRARWLGQWCTVVLLHPSNQHLYCT